LRDRGKSWRIQKIDGVSVNVSELTQYVAVYQLRASRSGTFISSGLAFKLRPPQVFGLFTSLSVNSSAYFKSPQAFLESIHHCCLAIHDAVTKINANTVEEILGKKK
jgi:hypothetical protein